MKPENKETTVVLGRASTEVVKTVKIEKTPEQLAHEFVLDEAIPETDAPGSNDETAQPGQNDAAKPDAVESLYGLLCLVPIGLNVGGLPKTASVWNENACRTLASAVIPVCRKYPWGVKVILFLETGGGVEEMALVAAVAPLALATYAAYQADTYVEPKEKEVNQTGPGNDTGN